MSFPESIKTYLRMIKFSHSVFALPFALTAAVIAAGGLPSVWETVWIIVAMVGARSGAMGMTGLKLMPMFLTAPGSAGGGYDGGAVFGVPDKHLDTEDRDWSKLPPRVREKLLEGWDESYPPEFRELLEIYFERIR